MDRWLLNLSDGIGRRLAGRGTSRRHHPEIASQAAVRDKTRATLPASADDLDAREKKAE